MVNSEEGQVGRDGVRSEDMEYNSNSSDVIYNDDGALVQSFLTTMDTSTLESELVTFGGGRPAAPFDVLKEGAARAVHSLAVHPSPPAVARL